MMKRFFSPSLVLAFAVVLFSCKKNNGDVAVDFGPLTAGSSWTYQATTDGGAPSSYTLTVTNRDTVINGRTYRVLSNSNGGSNYRNKSGNHYYSFGSVAALGLQLEQLILKDNENVNATWQSTVPITVPGVPIPLTATLIYKIKEKGISRTVSGKNFTNVIRVGLLVSVSGFAGEVVDADFYHAAGVGLIEDRYEVKNLVIAGIPNSTTVEILTSHTIR